MVYSFTMLNILFNVLGGLGLGLISLGVIIKDRFRQGVLFFIGGLFLLAYSVFVRDIIFTALQLVFLAAASYTIYETSYSI